MPQQKDFRKTFVEITDDILFDMIAPPNNYLTGEKL